MISFLWPWYPLCQLFLYYWSHLWTPEDLLQPCSTQIFVLLSSLKKKKASEDWAKFHVNVHDNFRIARYSIFKYGWTSPQWPFKSPKKVTNINFLLKILMHNLSQEKVARINKMITKWIMVWFFIKFSQLHVIN